MSFVCVTNRKCVKLPLLGDVTCRSVTLVENITAFVCKHSLCAVTENVGENIG